MILWTLLVHLTGCERPLRPRPKRVAHVVAFTAPWCEPCRRGAVVLDDLAATGDVSIEYVDVDRCPHVAREYDVRRLPTYFVYDSSGRLVTRTGDIGVVAATIDRLRAGRALGTEGQDVRSFSQTLFQLP